MLTTYDVEQRSAEWFELRCGIVTASVVGKLISIESPDATTVACPACEVDTGPCLSIGRKQPTLMKTVHAARTAAANALPPFYAVADNDTSRGVTATLVAERITGFVEPSFLTNDMMRGLEDEPRALDAYSKHHAPVETCGFMVLERDGWRLGFSPDGLVGEEGIVEVKSRRQKKQLTTVLADEAPAENYMQLQCGLLVTGRDWCDYISYSGGMHLWTKRVYPDPKVFEAIVAAVAAFEARAERMVSDYLTRVDGLPMTERIDPNIVELKL